ncbi:MAG: 3-oxoacyl-[acyl-carrier protein] reductase [Blastocatellia bacterium]|nr:3-oxoacyl-[acyl-carrier protein] reductase [Blastocatellia bacterium]
MIAMQFPDLRGRIAVVTGAGRARGIGAAICRALADQGCRIFFTTFPTYDRGMYPDDPEDLGGEELSEELRQRGAAVSFIEADLGQTDCPDFILNKVEESMGKPSILVNNAAYSARDGFETLDAAGLDAHYKVNVRGAVLLSVEFARRFSGESGGRIIYLTSGQDLGPMPGELAYAASKGAICAFMRSFAKEVGSKGITVNAVDPGPTNTGWMSEELQASLIRQNPAGRLGSPEDAARVIVFLASSAAEWISGQVIHSRGI